MVGRALMAHINNQLNYSFVPGCEPFEMPVVKKVK